MGLELDLKLARIADEFTSENIHIAKDRAGPLILSSETDSLFILTAHLRGYSKRNVKIEINEDGTQMVISGEKSVQENVFVGWKLYKKEAEIKRFRKAFKIPDGVILDKINAKFDEDESVLTVSMPKKEKGICGFNIEEVKEQVDASGSSETLPVASENPKDIVSDKIVNYAEQTKETDIKPLDTPQNKELEPRVELDHTNKSEIIQSETSEQDDTITNKSVVQEPYEKLEEENKQNKPKETESNEEKSVINDRIQESEVHQEVRPIDKGNNEDKGRSFKICVPAIAGSAFLLSLVVFVIHYVKTKTQSNKRNE